MLDYGYVSTQDAVPSLEELFASPVVSFDIESSGVNVATDVPYGFSLAHREIDAYYTHMHNRAFTNLLADDSVLKVAHNAKFDHSMLKKSGVIADNLCCTMIAAHLLEENRLSLPTLLKRNVRSFDFEVKPYTDFPKHIPHATLQELAQHFGSHAAGALILWNRLQRELRANGLWDVFWKTEMPVVPVLSDMELTGALIDTAYLEELGQYYDGKVGILEEGLFHYAGRRSVNFNSADQAALVLYNEQGVPKPPKHKKDLWTDKGRPSVDKTWLEQFKGKFPIVSLYLQYKAYRHLKDTYVTGILRRLVNSRIHTNFNQTRTRTGRLSSTDANLQNIPQRSEEGRKIRRAFIAPPGSVIMKADYIQMELKKMAVLSGCRALLDDFRNGKDIHEQTAIRAYKDAARRPEGKTLDFKLIYGGGDEETQRILFEIYPEVKQWTGSKLKDFELLGYAKTMRGRREHLGDFSRMNAKEIAHAHRQGISIMDQGSCSEVIKEAMYRVWKQVRDSDVKMLLQVHDELVFEVPARRVREMYHLLHKEMTFTELEIPLTVDVSVGPNWTEQAELVL